MKENLLCESETGRPSVRESVSENERPRWVESRRKRRGKLYLLQCFFERGSRAVVVGLTEESSSSFFLLLFFCCSERARRRRRSIKFYILHRNRLSHSVSEGSEKRKQREKSSQHRSSASEISAKIGHGTFLVVYNFFPLIISAFYSFFSLILLRANRCLIMGKQMLKIITIY